MAPTTASADPSDPPNCFGPELVAPAAQSGIGPYERSIAPSSEPGTIAAEVAAFNAGYGS